MIIKSEIIDSKVVLSICIPTFNRINKTLGLVKNILIYEGNDIEVVVLDNCSTDDTQLLLNDIKDKRFIYKRNNQNIGSMPNVLKALTCGSGEFKMLCLDKDRIISENLPYLIQHILADSEVVVGQCVLNADVFGGDLVYDQGLSSLSHLAYTSEHPSGLFVKNSVLKNSGIINKIINNNKTFAFNTELLKAEMTMLGKSKRINIPVVHTETLDECEKEVSHTYKGDNIYFFPKKIIETFNIYIDNLYSLNLSNEHKSVVVRKTFSSLLNSSTIVFKSIMENKSICRHHGISTRNISVGELIKIDYSFSMTFMKSDLPISFFYKFYICIIANIKMGYFMARSKFKK